MPSDTSWFRLSAAVAATLCDEERPEDMLRAHPSSKGQSTDLIRYPGASTKALILSEAAAALITRFRLPAHQTRTLVLQRDEKPVGRYVLHDMQPTKLDLRFVDYSLSRFFSVTARGARRYHELNSAEDHERLVLEIGRLNARRDVLQRERLDCERITFVTAASPSLDLFIAPDWELCFHIRQGLKEAIESAGLTGFSFGSRSRLYLC